MRVGGLKASVGQEHCIGRGGARLNSGCIQAGGVQRVRHNVNRCGTYRRRDAVKRKALGVRAV